MPQQQPDKRILKLISVYQQARKRLLNIIFNTELNGTVATYQRAILKQVEAELTALNVDCQKWCQGTLPGFYEEGIENVNAFLTERGLPITGDFSKLNKKAVDIIIDNTIIDLTTANNFVGRRVKDDLREISLDVIGQKIATGSSVQQAKSMLIDRILNQGIAFIKDGKEQISIKNKSYQLDKYAEMVARSTTREATNRGTLNQLTNLGYDLVQMSWHNSPCPICAQYEGRIYSISGNDSRFPPLEFAYSSINSGGHANVHPNCFVDSQIPIMTSKGWKGIGEIKLNDLVLTHQGRFRKVTFLHRGKGRKRIVKIQTNNLKATHWAKLSITEGHPILINDTWVRSEEVKIGDKIKVLAKHCEMCGSPTPLFQKHCSKECKTKSVITKRDTPMWRENLSKAISKSMKYRYANGLIDTQKITEKAHEKSRQMVIDGIHPFQKLENHVKAQKSLGSKHYGKTWIEEKMGWYLKEKLGLDIESQFPIPNGHIDTMGRERFFFADFLIKDKDIVIECDGSNWHQDEEKDKLRQEHIEKLGYTVLRFTDKQIKTDLVGCGNEVLRVLANHNHEYLFMDLEVTNVEIQEPKRTYPLYNLSVEEDESYIAKGFVVHNCRHILSPYIEEFADDLEADIEFSREFLSESEIQDRVSGYYEQQKEKRELYRDQRQYEKYKMVMGKKIGSFDSFRDKKEDPDRYEELKRQYREKKKELLKYG